MMVSVCIITYNHEKYIAETLDGIAKQKTSFPMEVIIGEDCSKDGTRAICEHYANKYPDLIKLLPSDKNIGMLQNFDRTFKACTGKYIAFTEGDDYWTDDSKLQKQVEFLEANPAYSACFHNVIIKSERKNNEKEWIMHDKLLKDSFDTQDLLGPWFIATTSFVFVNYPDFQLPDWFYKNKFLGDLPLMLLLSLRGSFKYMDEVMAVYRLHDTGMTTKYTGYDKIIAMVYLYESFNIYTNYRFNEKAKQAMIYEIDRHMPKPATNDAQKNEETKTLQKKFLKKMKTIFK